MFLSHFLFVDLLIGLTIISAPVQGSLTWVYPPGSGALLQPLSGESFIIYCFTHNSSHSLSFKLNNQTLSNNDEVTIETVPLPPATGKQLKLMINAFSMATAGILTCQAHSGGSVIQEKNKSITGQNYSLSIVGSLIEEHNASLHCQFYSPGRNASGYTWRGRSNDSQEFVLLAGISSVLNVNFSLIFDEYSCEVSVTPTDFKLTTNRTVTAAYFIPKLTANSTIASTVLIGDSITLHCSITGTGLKYTWSRQDGVPFSSLKALTLHNVCYTNAGVYQCTASNLAGNESQIHYLTVQGIASSPVIADTVKSPGLLVLRVRTMYPGDINIRFIVNVTNVSDESIISSTTHHFNNYQANDIVNINISIPNGGSVSVSIVTINQYGASDDIIKVVTIDPIFSTTVLTIATTSVTAASISTATVFITYTPTTTPQTVDRSGLSSGSIAGITISIFILLIVFVILFALQHLCLRKKNKEVIPSASNEVYAAVVNVQENVAYSQRQTITAGSHPTGSSTTPAVYETVNF